jgi:cobalt/nickel transport system permease protein
MIPPWLGRSNPAPAVAGRGSGRACFLEKTIAATTVFAGETFRNDSLAERNGLLQGIEPRCKLAAVLALIVAASLVRSPVVVWGISCLALLLAALSRVGGRLLARRVWLFVILFAGMIALPAAFNVITPGEPLWVVAQLGKSRVIGPYRIPAELAVTRQGLLSAALLVGRVAASVSLAGLLALTTRWDRLLGALPVVRVPQLFILTLAMTYRYLALLVGTAAEMHEARLSRTVRYLSTGDEQRWVATRMGFLFRKSWRLSQDVHAAMLARGFTGEIRTIAPLRVRGRDIAFLAAMLAVCAGVVGVDRFV